MSMFSRKSSKVAKRIDRIEGELSTISSRIKTLSRDVERKGDAVVQRAGQGARTTVPVKKPVESSSSMPDSMISTGVVAGSSDVRSAPSSAVRDVYREERKTPRESSGTAARLGARDDEQFANYFMSGGLKKEVVEPLRRERHMQRRKALFLLLCFVALLFALLFFKVWSQ